MREEENKIYLVSIVICKSFMSVYLLTSSKKWTNKTNAKKKKITYRRKEKGQR